MRAMDGAQRGEIGPRRTIDADAAKICVEVHDVMSISGTKLDFLDDCARPRLKSSWAALCLQCSLTEALEGFMKRYFLAASAVVALSLAASPAAEAAGCLKGAAVGAVAGHFAHHHAILGAIAGCAIGHHLAAEKEKQRKEERAHRLDSPPANVPAGENSHP